MPPSIAELTGQLICPVLPQVSRADLPRLARSLDENHWGGFIVFRGGPELAEVLAELQARSERPLLVAGDIEFGAGQQLEGATFLPPLMALGAIDSEDVAYEAGRITAVEARARGVNWAFAPVADVNVNPRNPIINIRSFGGDPGRVGRLAAAWVRGAQEHGLLATAKHFPGHGDTAVDSHSRLPTILADRSRLDAVELAPFRECIAAGVGAVMTAHLAVPALDGSGVPATLSKAIMTDLLRHQMGFSGLVVTDALIMGGITGTFGEAEAVAAALDAGCDVLLMPRDAIAARQAILTAVERGLVPESRLREAFGRLEAARRRLGLVGAGTAAWGASDFAAHRIFARKLAERAMTLVRGGEHLPLGPGAFFVIVDDDDDAVVRQAPGAEFAGRLHGPLAEELDRRKIPWVLARPGLAPEVRAEILDRASHATTVGIGIFALVKAWKDRSDLSADMAQLVRDLAGGEAPVVAVSFNSPYLVAQFPAIAGYACAYGPLEDSQRAAVRALCGEIPFAGRLPVELS